MPSYKIVYGNEDTIVSKLQQAFTKIMQTPAGTALYRSYKEQHLGVC